MNKILNNIEKRGYMKKGQSNIIAIVLIILIVLIALIIVWNVVFPMIKNSSQGIFSERISVGFESQKVDLLNDDSYRIQLKRTHGEGKVTKLRIVAWDGNSSCTKEVKTDMEVYSVRNFDIDCSGTGLNSSNIKEITLAPYVLNPNGKEILGRSEVVYKTGD